VNTFDGADFVTRSIAETLTGTVELDLSEGSEPVELPNDAWVFARVRGTDADGISSPWDVITFFSRGENDPPDVPLLLDPEDNATWESEEAPTLTIGNVTDPEGDDVSYDYAVWADAEGTLELAAVLGIAPDPSGQTTIDWPEEVPLEGDVYWTARSTDDLDARSEWAFPNLLRFDIQTGPITGDDDDSADTGDDDDGGGGCDCDSSLVSEAAPTSALLLLLAPVAALLRRRR
jgi:hypothetical protein